MRTAPGGQAGLNPMGPAQAQSRALDQADQPVDIQPQTVTSHSLTLTTKAFSLDFTWRRVESDQLAARPALAGPAAESPSPGPQSAVEYDHRARTTVVAVREPVPAPVAARAPRQSFAEVLRRRQLAGLVLMPSRPPADRLALRGPMATAEPQPGPVCRAYAEALGPLGAETSRLYTA